MTDDELIRRALAGHRSAYDELAERYRDLAWRTALVLLRSPDDAEEAMQAAMLKVWLHLDRFRIGSPFRPWLLRIVGNEARNLRLARTRRWQRFTGMGDDDPPDRSPALDEVVIVAERSIDLVRHIDRLPLGDREVIHARFVLELSEHEIAALLGIRPGTVKSRLHRAIGRLRIAIDAGMEDWR